MFKTFFNWFAHNCLNCRDAVRLVSESCERDLTFGEKMKLKVLCAMCPYTSRYNEQIGALRDRLSECGDETVGVVGESRLSEECKKRLREKMVVEESSS